MTEPTVTLKGFFERVGRGEITGLRCGKCGDVSIPPKEFCPTCRERAWETVSLSGQGTIASYTVIRVAPARHAADAPYAVAVVQLAEGPSLFGRVVDIPFDRLAVGLPVKFRPIVVQEQAAVGFGPA